MKVELKQIIDELTDAIGLPEGRKVAAYVKEGKVVGWTIVDLWNGYNLISDKKFNNIKELLIAYYGLREEV